MQTLAASRSTFSDAARRRMLAVRGEPMFYARWDRAVFIHYETDPATLQADIPFELDLRDGRAFVSVVAFTLVKMRPRLGGRLGEWLLKPIATHEFLNIRTYVRHRGEPGIYFLAEWLSNRLSVHLGPRSFGLPYRYGSITYDHARDGATIRGAVAGRAGQLSYAGEVCGKNYEPADAESLEQFLMERYTAFTQHRKRSRFFRVWHLPWPQASARCDVGEASLIASTGAWWHNAEFVGANYSPGVGVWMGRPHRTN
jgi:uncharacterized protein YqjF (DUF2071 family)